MRKTLIIASLLIVCAVGLCAQSSPAARPGEQNFAVRVQGQVAADTAMDFTLVVVSGGRSSGQYDVKDVEFPNVREAVMGTLSISISPPSPSSHAPEGAYLVDYQIIVELPVLGLTNTAPPPRPPQVTNAIRVAAQGVTGQVIIKPGQTIRIADMPAVGPLELTLTAVSN